jgi:anti-sigma factor RsiW
MRCDEALLLEYLDGTLDPIRVEQLEAHLLLCDECWWNVRTDRWGRDLARAARELAPADLADRIELAVTLERDRPPRRRFRRGLALAGVLAALIVAGVVGVTSSAPPRPGDPALVAAVVAVSTSQGAVPETLTVGHASVGLSQVYVGETPVVVARSDQPFPMPEESDPVPGHPDAWATRRGSLNIVCVASPSPLLLVGEAELDELVAAIS